MFPSSYNRISIIGILDIKGQTLFTKETIKVTFAPNLAKKINTNFYYLSLLFQLSVAYNSENFKEIKAWEVLKFLKEKIGILPIYFAWRKKHFMAFFKFEVPFLLKVVI